MTRNRKHPAHAPQGTGHRARRTLHRLAASDPGPARLHIASRTVIGLAVTLGVLSLVDTLAGQPLTVTIVGMVATMVGSIAINEPRGRERLITGAATIVTNAAAAILGILVSPYLVASDVLFIAIAAVGTACQTRWPRAIGLTLSAFMTSFFAVFLGFELSQLGWVVLSLAVGTAIAVAMTFTMPVRNDRRRRRSERVLRARLRLLLAVVRSGLEEPAADSRHRQRIWDRMDPVAETALSIEGLLDADSERRGTEAFDVELAAGNLAYAWSRAASVPTPEAGARSDEQARGDLMAALDALDAGLGPKGVHSVLPTVEELSGRVSSSGADERFQIVATALIDLARAAAWTDDSDQSPGGVRTAPDRGKIVPAIPRTEVPEQTEDARTTPAADAPEPASAPGGLSFGTRRTIQVTTAMIVAVVAGELISPDRWYWALVAAFAIFGPTVTRGETLVRGWTRIVGTVFGAVAGTYLAELVAGDVFWSTVLIFAVIFFAFYLMQVSYALMMTGITMMLALLYGVLGTFSPEVLGTRILLTAVGAVIGVAAALVVLPVRTHDTVREKVQSYLRSLDDVVAAAARRVMNPDEADLTARVRELDRALAAVRAGVKPLEGGPFTPGFRRAGTRRTLGLLRYATHNAQGLARVARPTSDADTTEAIARAADHVRGNITHLSATLDRVPVRALTESDDAVVTLRSDIPPKQEDHTVLARCLHKIDLAVVQLCTDLTGRTTAIHRATGEGRQSDR
ncbi:FUSC family protein [Streptomyces sp. NPDC056296]|uniref:FUSC family protein n=1 Tax=Streptomyces sp. NPDC056296 TaxID=3345775 RepID=UPI0035DE9A8B